MTLEEVAELVNDAEEIALVTGRALRQLPSEERRRLLAEAAFADERRDEYQRSGE